jgi:transposase
MKDLIADDDATIDALRARLKQAKSIAEFRRVQCVLMRVALGISAADIALALGWATETVHVMHSRWAKEGEAMFDLKGLGWAQSPEPDRAAGSRTAASFVEQATAGNILKVAEIQAAYEARVGKAVPNSTIYRMLQRHGWRKVAPRPRHPKADVAAQDAFKKASPSWCAAKSVAKRPISAACE